MNRGNRREDIFITDKDRKVFLEGLADSCEIYHIKLVTYVLMATYTVRFNRRNRRAGHVFLSDPEARAVQIVAGR
jgi:hypothetical protein